MSLKTSLLTGAIDAIHAMQESKGSSLKAIKAFMKTYPLVGVPARVESRSLLKVLDIAVRDRVLHQEDGRYKICSQSILRELRTDDTERPVTMASMVDKGCKPRRRPRSCGKKRKRSRCGKKRKRSRCGKKRKRSRCGKKRKSSRRRRSCGKKRKRSRCGKKRKRSRSKCGKKRRRSRRRGCSRPKRKRSCGRKRKSKRSCGRKRKRSRSSGCRPKRCRNVESEDKLVKRRKCKADEEPKRRTKRSSPVAARRRPRKEEDKREGDSQPLGNQRTVKAFAMKCAKEKQRRVPNTPEDWQNVPSDDMEGDVRPVGSYHSNHSIHSEHSNVSQPEGEDRKQ